MLMTEIPPHHSTGVMLAMINGRVCSEDAFKVSAYDRGLCFGDGVYEVIQAYNGAMWGPDLHFRRLAQSLEKMGIPTDGLADYRAWVAQAFDLVERRDCLMYFHVTRGCAVRTHVPGVAMTPQFLLMVKPPIDNTARAANGIAAITHPDERWKRCDIKSLNLLPNVLARQRAYAAGAEEAIFFDDDNVVTEAAISSVFIVDDGALVSRPLGNEVLPGLTRLAMLALATKYGIPAVERTFTLDELGRAAEIIVSGSGEEVRSVVRLDDRPVGDGRPGPVGRRLTDAFVEVTRACESFEDLVAEHLPDRFALM